MPFTYRGATIALKPLTIADDDDILLLRTKLDSGLMNTAEPFAEFMIGAAITGTPPLTMVTKASTKAEVNASYAEWMALPRKFLFLWKTEVNRAENENDPNA